MNLHNLSEKDFDAEIKRHLENSSVPFDPLSWDKMSQELDSVFPKTDTGKSRLFELLVVALLLSSLFFWSVGTFPQTIPSLDDSNNTQVSQPLNDQKSTPSGVLEQDKSERAKSDNQGLLHETELINQALKSETTFSSPEEDNAAINPGTDINKSNVNNSNYAQTSTTQVLTSKESSINKTAEATALGLPNVALIAPNTPEIQSIDQQNLPDEIKEIDLNTTEEPPVIAVPSSPWFLGFGYAPDISLVGFSEVTRPGTNLIILLEYQLNRRWSINSGITYSKKIYTADGEDYHPPKGFWDYGFVPDMTDGYCDVIDIPLNIRYYFKPEKINRLFASTGLSTYLMLTEDYYYQYENNDPQHLVQSWSGKNENQHYFAIYNLSVGYQRAIGKQWFLEIEPFIKLPLTGIGFGDVDLWSTGSSFSIKYNFR